jgi:hypothetical protein
VLDATILNFTSKAPKRFNTFGGSIGGPIKIPHFYYGKDKTFFFLDYEGNRRRTATPEQYLVPTAAERNGDLSGLPIISPQTGQPTNVAINPGTGAPFPNNAIPASMLNPVSKNLLNGYYPLPNVNSAGSSYNYETLQPIPSNTNGFDGRLDHYITSNQQIFARFSWKNLLSDAGQSGPANPLVAERRRTEHDRSFIVSYNYTISPKMVNEFRFGFTNSLIQHDISDPGRGADDQLGLTGISFANHPTTGAFPTFNFSDGTGFTPIGRDKDGPALREPCSSPTISAVPWGNTPSASAWMSAGCSTRPWSAGANRTILARSPSTRACSQAAHSAISCWARPTRISLWQAVPIRTSRAFNGEFTPRINGR